VKSNARSGHFAVIEALEGRCLLTVAGAHAPERRPDWAEFSSAAIRADAAPISSASIDPRMPQRPSGKVELAAVDEDDDSFRRERLRADDVPTPLGQREPQEIQAFIADGPASGEPEGMSEPVEISLIILVPKGTPRPRQALPDADVDATPPRVVATHSVRRSEVSERAPADKSDTAVQATPPPAAANESRATPGINQAGSTPPLYSNSATPPASPAERRHDSRLLAPAGAAAADVIAFGGTSAAPSGRASESLNLLHTAFQPATVAGALGAILVYSPLVQLPMTAGAAGDVLPSNIMAFEESLRNLLGRLDLLQGATPRAPANPAIPLAVAAATIAGAQLFLLRRNKTQPTPPQPW